MKRRGKKRQAAAYRRRMGDILPAQDIEHLRAGIEEFRAMIEEHYQRIHELLCRLYRTIEIFEQAEKRPSESKVEQPSRLHRKSA